MTEPTIGPVCRKGNKDHVLVIAKGFCSTPDEAVDDWRDSIRNSGWKGQIWRISWDGLSARKLQELVQDPRQLVAVLASAVSPIPFVPSAGAVAGTLPLIELFRQWFLRSSDNARTVGRSYGPKLLDELPHAHVSVLGFSLGAYLMFHLLQLEAESGRQRIKDAILLGAAVPSSPLSEWKQARSGCTGRVLNCYHSKDIVLDVLYPFATGEKASGCRPVQRAKVNNLKGDRLSALKPSPWLAAVIPAVLVGAPTILVPPGGLQALSKELLSSHLGWVDAIADAKVRSRLPWNRS